MSMALFVFSSLAISAAFYGGVDEFAEASDWIVVSIITAIVSLVPTTLFAVLCSYTR